MVLKTQSSQIEIKINYFTWRIKYVLLREREYTKKQFFLAY